MYLLRLNLRVELKSKLIALIFENNKKFDGEQGLASTTLLMGSWPGVHGRDIGT